MVTNLCAAGKDERAAICQAEEEVWQRRTEASIQQAPLAKERLASLAVDTMCGSFMAGTVKLPIQAA
jgi:hypothetical protein